jgi:transcriptional regulator with XRE-family HTH domain
MQKFLERLNECRNGMSVSAFSRFLGLNQKTLDLYIKGDRKPSVELVVAVCSKCGRSADWLLGITSQTELEQTDWRARAVIAEKKLERVNRALGHALKGFEELQEAVK